MACFQCIADILAFYFYNFLLFSFGYSSDAYLKMLFYILFSDSTPALITIGVTF